MSEVFRIDMLPLHRQERSVLTIRWGIQYRYGIVLTDGKAGECDEPGHR
ncbi:hypothetical protein CCP3SC1_570023 [Gammaproteobacteria bacterium]